MKLFTEENSALHKYEIYLLIVGSFFFITVITIIGFITKKELERFIEEQEREQPQAGRKL